MQFLTNAFAKFWDAYVCGESLRIQANIASYPQKLELISLSLSESWT